MRHWSSTDEAVKLGMFNLRWVQITNVSTNKVGNIVYNNYKYDGVKL